MQKRAKKTGTTPQALLDRPLVSDQIIPYYRGWNLLEPRRQFNESGAQAASMVEVIEVARLMIGNDPDDVYEFCAVITAAESAILKELADMRKRELEKAKRKNK